MLIDDKSVILTAAELQALDEYSLSMPTGTIVGKRWKRKLWKVRGGYRYEDGWLMGEYVAGPDGRPDYVGVVWREVRQFS